ncbi:phosphagen kinase [Deinococcota bacterium DY0809b]
MVYPELQGGSLLARHLTPEVWRLLNDKETRYGVRLAHVVASGLANPDSSVGVYAGDEESYTLFAPLFDPIIADYHGFGPENRHQSDLDPARLNAPNPDPEGRYVVSTRIRVARNLCCFPFGSALTRRERRIVEATVVRALEDLQGELAGSYHPLYEMDETTKERLIHDHFLFKEGDRFLEAAGLNRDWPDARGIFHNPGKTFLVWVNEEDQLRIISMEPGSDLQRVFARLARALAELERRLAFAHSERLGYLTSCPTNLGTAMRASVHVRLPRLAADEARLTALAAEHGLQVRGTHGEHSASEGAVYDVSNKRRLGITEVEAVRGLANGVAALIAAEERA